MNIYRQDAEYVFDDRAFGYRLIGENICLLAEGSFGIDLDTTTRERWQQLLGLLREVDTLADERINDPQSVLNTLSDYTVFASGYPALSPAALGDERFGTMVDRTQTILDIGQAISQTDDRNTYIELRKAEAYYSAQLLAESATDTVVQQPEFGSFMHCITGFGVGANMVDSVLDARYDYRRGAGAVKPSFHLYASLGKETVKHALPHLYRAFHPAAVRGRKQAAVYRITHRLSHGMSPDSSFKIFRPTAR